MEPPKHAAAYLGTHHKKATLSTTSVKKRTDLDTQEPLQRL